MSSEPEVETAARELAAIGRSRIDMDGEQSASAFARIRNTASSVKELNILIALTALCTFLSLASPYFLTSANALGVARAFSLTAIAAICRPW